MLTCAETELPRLSKAVAVSVCGPLTSVVVSSAQVYGDLPSSLSALPSTEKRTRLMSVPVASQAAPCTVPETVAPEAGALNETVTAACEASGNAAAIASAHNLMLCTTDPPLATACCLFVETDFLREADVGVFAVAARLAVAAVRVDLVLAALAG